MSSGKVSVAESICGAGENGSVGSIKERGGMRGMVRRRRLARTGAAPPCTVDGVAGDRTRVGRPTLASLWASAIAENCADSKAGRGYFEYFEGISS